MMNKFTILVSIVAFALIFVCNAQDDPFEIPEPEIPPIKNQIPDFASLQIPTIPPIIINPTGPCSLVPLSARCNPCKYGQPLTGIPCGQGQNQCAASGGTCKVNRYDRAYCCPKEHRGCCPPVPSPPVVFPLPLCFPTCTTDAQCENHQKCCGSCRRCVTAIVV